MTITAAGFLSPAPVAATDESAQTAEQINRGRNRACQGLKGMALQDCLSNYVGPERSGRDSVYVGERRDGKESRYERPARPREKPGRE